MTRIAVVLIGLYICICSSAWASGEIGYVDDFIGKADRYQLIRDHKIFPVKLCLPLLSGDHIVALDDAGRMQLRMIDHPDVVVWSRGDKDTPLTAIVSKESYWSGFLDWTVASLSPFDDQKRERVLTAIRGDGGAKFDVPLLNVPQVMASGKRIIVIGWLKPSAVIAITITDKSGKLLVDKGKAAGGLWSSPVLNLIPGTYRISAVSGAATITNEIKVVDSTKIPSFPEELTRASVPEPLRHTVQALWLSAQDDGRYQLEALQLIANDTNVRSAKVLSEALIGGTKFSLPK